MKRYVIEREIPGIGNLSSEEFKEAAKKSNSALAELAGKVQWVQSFVANDKTFCVYLADSEEAIQKHAEISGFPANELSEIRLVFDPITAHQ
jgi:predicted transcriptional regulator